MKVLKPVALLLLVCSAVVEPAEEGVAAELYRVAANNGWFLVHFAGTTATILSFTAAGTGHSKRRTMPHFYASASTADGTCVAYVAEPSDESRGFRLVIASAKGDEISSSAHISLVRELAISADCRRVAVDGVYLQMDESTGDVLSTQGGLFYVNFSNGNVRLISQRPRYEEFRRQPVITEARSEPSWSPDGSKLAFEEGDSIFVEDTVRNERRFLVPGRRPAWSPNGKWLGYQSLDGVPMVLTLATGKSEPLAGGVKCLASIKWTPDSQFAIFTQHGNGGTVYKVCRMRDRAVEAFYSLTLVYPESQFMWITRSLAMSLLAPGQDIP